MTNWKESAKKSIENRAEKSPVTAPLKGQITTGIDTKTKKSSSWMEGAQKSLDKRGYIAPEKRSYELKSADGKSFGTISYGAYNALLYNKADSYTPKNDEEKNIITEYRNYPGFEFKKQDGSTLGKVTYDGYVAISKGQFDSYTPKNDAEKATFEAVKNEPYIPLSVEVDGETKNFGKISYNAYKAITNGTIGDYTPANDSEAKVISDYTKFPEEYAKKQREPKNVGQGILHGIGYTAEKIGAGALDGLSDIGSFLLSAGATVLRPFTWGSWNKALKDYAGYQISSDSFGDMWNESAEKRYRIPDWYREYLGTTAYQFGSLAPAIAAEAATMGAAPSLETTLASQIGTTSTMGTVAKTVSSKLIKPKVSDVVFGLSAAGSAAKEGYLQSGDIDSSLRYGILNGLGEVATEKLFGGLGGTGIGADDLIDLSKIKGIQKIASNKYGEKILSVGLEGVEEMIMAEADPIFQRLTVNPNAEFADFKDLGESAFQGILLSAFSNVATLPLRTYQKAKAINILNKTTESINAIMSNDTDKFEPLKYNATEAEIEERQKQIKVFSDAYAEIAVNDVITSNPDIAEKVKTNVSVNAENEKISSETAKETSVSSSIFEDEHAELQNTELPALSVGDVFRNVENGMTLKVIARDENNTTMVVGDNKTPKIFSNKNADMIFANEKYEQVESTETAPNAETESAPKNITLTRAGDFYEAYGDEAVELSNKLGLTLTSKTVNGKRVQMVGFPVSTFDSYKNKLGSGYNISISDENISAQESKGSDLPASFKLDENGKIRFNQADIDYTNSEMRRGEFRISKFRANEPKETIVRGWICGKYGVHGNEENGAFVVTHLQSGIKVTDSKKISESKRIAEYFNENLSFNDVSYIRGASGTSFYPEKTDEFNAYTNEAKNILDNKLYAESVSNEIENGKVPFSTKAGLVDYVKSHIGNKISVSLNNGTTEVRTLEGISNTSLRTKKPDGTVSTADLKGLKFSDTGFSVDYSTGVSATFDFVNVAEKAASVTVEDQSNTPEQTVEAGNDTLKLTDKCELVATKHTSTGDDIWVITLKDRISPEEYKDLSGKVKTVGGYYSRFAKTPDGKPIPGFVFKTEPTAKEFKVFNDFFKSSNEPDLAVEETPHAELQSVEQTAEKIQKETQAPKIKEEFKVGDVLEFDGEQWKCVNIDPMMIDFVNVNKKALQQNMSVILPYEVFKKKTDYKVISQRATPEGKTKITVGLTKKESRDLSGNLEKLKKYTAPLKNSSDSDIIKENKDRESVKNVHDGLLEGEGGNDNAVREPEPISEAKEKRNTGTEDRELDEDGASENGKHIQASEAETSAAGQHDSRDSDNRVRESDDSDGNSRTGAYGNDNVDVTESSKAKDFVITKTVAEDIDKSAPSITDNIKAIETLHDIEKNGKAPTKTQQGLLAKFKGWGGLSGAFYGVNRAKLQKLMSEGELKVAQSTVNDAYFTPTSIIDGIYKALSHLGFEGGNILEPSMGIGNFFGRMPKVLKDNSSLFGVEIDSISGRIAQQLYPSANIEIAPFQDVAYKDGVFDLIIGNVPFGEVKYNYKGKKYLIHDYFFVKAMDKLNDGGILMFLTTKGTLDKLDSTTRTELSKQGKLLGAYRLPSDVFTKSAGASVVTDLIIMQKTSDTNGENFINLGTVAAGIGEFSVNEYFVNHPENVIGKFTSRKDWRSGKEVLDVVATGNVAEQLVKAIRKLPKNLLSGVQTVGSVNVTENNAPVQTFNVTENDTVEYIDAVTGEVKQIKGKSAKTAKDYVALKDAYQELVDATLNGYETDYIESKRKTLNTVYDGFVKKYGALENNKKLLSADNDFYKMSGLEVYDTKTKKIVKSEMFAKDTLGKRKPKKADSVLDALSISIGETGGVDVKRIADLTGVSESEAIKQLDDRIVYTPDGIFELNEVYLSGNVREKYDAVKGKKGFEKNEKMLEMVIPEDIPAKNITPQFGSPWINPDYVADFLKEMLHLYNTPIVSYDPTTGTWSISGNTWGDNTLLTNKYGTKYMDAIKIAEKALNLRRIVVTDKDTKKMLVGETRAAQQKAEDIKAAFEEWCFKDSDRRKDLVATFNRKFNSNRNMDFSELAKYLTFDGLTDTFKLRDYQKRAVARAVFNGNTLLAHGVGTGKTAEMIAVAMELKRMGIAKKNMMVVPNHKVADFRNDILKMYPSAKVAYLEKGANPEQRQRFYALVASNDFDIVVIPHSAFGMLDVSADTKRAFINNQIAELEEVLTAAQAEKGKIDGRFISTLENQKKRLAEKLKFVTESAKDSGNVFEELGVDSLFVDEAHNFKNLPFYSKLSRVAGVSINQPNNKTRASRAENMFMITDYLNRNGGRITFGTATPITNSMSEIYNMIRFLRPDILADAGLQSFDAWASMFGSIVNQAEVDPSGRNMRMKERFSKFKNVSQMIEQFRRMADILKTGDVIQELPIAERIDVYSEPNEIQEEFLDIVDEMIDDIRINGQRADYNMLEVTTAGQMAAIDLRLVASYFDGKYSLDELNLPNNRTSQVAQKVYKEYVDNNEIKGTQFIFCDKGVHDNPDAKYGFYVYGDLINKLVALGIPRNEIAVAQEFEDKADLSARVNTGEIRVLIGSTAVMGEGMNAQNKAVALHHMTVPDRPSDIEQREGRIIRYGNENKNVRIYRYIQEKSYDSYQWQMQERKAGFINQALSGGTVSELEEMSDFQLSAREAKAIASGNPLLLEKIEIEDRLNNLKSIRNKFNTDKLEMKDRLAVLPNRIAKKEKAIADTTADAKTVADNTPNDFEITLGKTKYSERAKAAEALKRGLVNAPRNGTHIKIGSYRGLDLYYTSSFDKGTHFILKGSGEYTTLSGDSASGNITRIINLAEKIGDTLDFDRSLVDNFKAEIETLKKEVDADFPRAKELEELQAKLNDIDTQLGINVSTVDMSDVIVDDEADNSDIESSKDLITNKYNLRSEADEFNTRRNVSKDGDEFGESKTGNNTGELLQEGNSVDHSGRRIPRTDEGGHRTVEERTIQEVISSDKFAKLSKFIVNNISYSLSKELYKTYQNDNRWDEGYEFPDIITYDILADENNELRELFSDNILEYFNTDVDITCDITGKKVSGTILSSTRKSVLKNEIGQLIPVYHGTGALFERFKSSDIGVHFGSYAQAVQRVKDKGIDNPRYIRAYLNIENPIYIDGDFFGWNSFQIAQKLSQIGIITSKEALSYFEKSKTDIGGSNRMLVDMLKTKGFDGIIYNNEFESISGKSYIVFDNEQIYRAEENSDVFYSSKDLSRTDETSRWTTERVESGKDKSVTLSEIINRIVKNFGIPISSGKVTDREASGIYKKQAEAIRTRISNDLPTISHELGHHLDKLYALSTFASVEEIKDIVSDEFLDKYPSDRINRELVAEFVRHYLKNRNEASKLCQNFYNDFISALSKSNLKALDSVADLVNEYLSYDISKRYKSSIVSAKEAKNLQKGSVKEHIKDGYDKFYTDWVYSFHPIKQLTDFVEKKTGENLQGSKSMYMLADNSLNAHAIANYIATEGFRDLDGNILRDKKSFVESIKSIDRKSMKDFALYLKLKHALEINSQGKISFADEILENPDYMRIEIAKLEKAHPEFVKAAEDVYEYQYNLLKYFAVPSGLMTMQQLDYLHEKYPCYVPFYRVIKGKEGSFARSSFANQDGLIKRLKGSGLDTLNPLESIVKNTEKIVKASLRHQTDVVLAEYADNVDGIGQFIEKLAPDMIPHYIDITELKSDFTEKLKQVASSSDNYFAVSELLDEVFGNDVMDFTPVANESKRIISVLRNGERSYYQIHNEELFKAITELSPKQTSGLLSIITKTMGITNILITQFNPNFAVSNPIRDARTAYKMSEIDNPVKFIKAYAESIFNIVTKSESYKQYKAMGGGYSAELTAHIEDISKTLRRVAQKDRGLAMRLVSSLLHPIDLVSSLNSFAESIPRFMEFQRVLNETGDLQKAIHAADDLTTNFKRHGAGSTSKVVNTMFRFNNASIQGLDRTRRAFIAAPSSRLRKIISKWLLDAILVSLFMFFWNRKIDEEGYKNLSSYKKNNFYNFAIGDGKFISLPKERENAVLNSLTERVIDRMIGGDENAFYDLGGYLCMQLLPPMLPDTLNPSEIAHSVLGNTVIGGFTDIGFNKDFKGTPIEGEYDRYIPSNERYNENTTKIAYALGQTKYARDKELSPKKIDHLISSYTGIIGQANKAFFPKSDSLVDPSLGLRNKFITDSNYSTDILNRLYENQEKAEKAFDYEDTVSNAIEYEKNSIITSFIAEMLKAIKALPEDEQRNGRVYLLRTLNSWNYENTESQSDMLSNLEGLPVSKDAIFSELPKSKLEWTEKKVKYSYQMTPKEYYEYIVEYLAAIEDARGRYGDGSVEGYEEAKAAAKDDMADYKKKILKKWYFDKAIPEAE